MPERSSHTYHRSSALQQQQVTRTSHTLQKYFANLRPLHCAELQLAPTGPSVPHFVHMTEAAWLIVCPVRVSWHFWQLNTPPQHAALTLHPLVEWLHPAFDLLVRLRQSGISRRHSFLDSPNTGREDGLVHPTRTASWPVPLSECANTACMCCLCLLASLCCLAFLSARSSPTSDRASSA